LSDERDAENAHPDEKRDAYVGDACADRQREQLDVDEKKHGHTQEQLHTVHT
jgi:hypothetical protein